MWHPLQTYHLYWLSSKQLSLKGRVSAEFSQRKVEKDPSLDTILADGDEIFIPLFTSDVYVTGDV